MIELKDLGLAYRKAKGDFYYSFYVRLHDVANELLQPKSALPGLT